MSSTTGLKICIKPLDDIEPGDLVLLDDGRVLEVDSFETRGKRSWFFSGRYIVGHVRTPWYPDAPGFHDQSIHTDSIVTTESEADQVKSLYWS